ncbi:MAG TPA: BRO family protein [Actinocrinis sp.]|uniref:BRO family protein n=1 Tax=Actinocrinis sp. TaxID=1920516 RepID=UPI002DDD5A1F|nr:BRO family protein [Actinocrinis sp.]HEV2347398.1 BRO family protein [Actinocrinis sp.]
MCIDDDGREYWSARDLMPLMGYTKWQDFTRAIERARVACKGSGMDPDEHFMDAHKVAASGPDALDVHLSRYACYLTAQNGDPRKPEVAAAQTYFAVKTREAETALPIDLPDITTPSRFSTTAILTADLKTVVVASATTVFIGSRAARQSRLPPPRATMTSAAPNATGTTIGAIGPCSATTTPAATVQGTATGRRGRFGACDGSG